MATCYNADYQYTLSPSRFYDHPHHQFDLRHLLFPSALFTIIALLFYKLNIIITDKMAVASFGVGIFKKSVAIEDLLLDHAEIIKTPWIWGVGYRFTPKGTLLNASFSKALYIPTTSSSFFVGSKNPKKLLESIIKIKEVQS